MPHIQLRDFTNTNEIRSDVANGLNLGESHNLNGLTKIFISVILDLMSYL